MTNFNRTVTQPGQETTASKGLLNLCLNSRRPTRMSSTIQIRTSQTNQKLFRILRESCSKQSTSLWMKMKIRIETTKCPFRCQRTTFSRLGSSRIRTMNTCSSELYRRKMNDFASHCSKRVNRMKKISSIITRFSLRLSYQPLPKIQVDKISISSQTSLVNTICNH